MKRKSSRQNILLAYGSSYPSGSRIASGALRRLADLPEWDVTVMNYKNQGFLRSVRTLSRKHPFDGIIAETSVPLTGGLRKALPKAVVVNAALPTAEQSNFGCIVDNAAIAKAAAATLVRLAPHHFAYVGVRSSAHAIAHSSARAQHFQRILADRGHGSSLLFADDPLLGQKLAALPKPIGIFAYNDRTAALVLSHCRALGIAVPDQASVVGVDNDPDICENTRPPLTSVSPDFEKAGRLAVEIMSAALRGQTPALHRAFGICGVVERGSTQSARTGSRMVTVVRELLRRHYAEKLTLQHLASRLKISTRLLSLRFREITGRSVHEELDEIRLTKAHRLLESQTSPIKAVATTCGFPSVENFYRRYRRRFGQTPRQSTTNRAENARNGEFNGGSP